MLATRVARIAFAAFAVCVSELPPSAGAQAPSPGPPAAAPGAAVPSPDPAGASLVDYYTADRSAAPEREQLELRLRDDGRAWLVTAPAPATSPVPAATAAPGRFETGTWQAIPTGVTVALDSVSAVIAGRPADPRPEKRDLTFAFAPCGLTLVAAVPAPIDPGPGGIPFAKRHCR
jgi:hypothetical protein